MPEGQTINRNYYLDVLRHLREAVCQKRPEKLHQKNWLLHHDNARPHTAVTVQLYLAKHGIALLPQPPYSIDLAPKDFFLYPNIEKVNTKNILKSLNDEDFQRCFEIWKKRWNKCIDSDDHAVGKHASWGHEIEDDHRCVVRRGRSTEVNQNPMDILGFRLRFGSFLDSEFGRRGVLSSLILHSAAVGPLVLWFGLLDDQSEGVFCLLHHLHPLLVHLQFCSVLGPGGR
ncbi:hypothetical protein LAZ67_11002258 [Cordylochernes scorpioides]|uniref:Transposase n=1 Tax=Cordylochernes scorpioides TaxID=51811 RepID=A0ABY6KZM2_9ARAC|nr:hypothetical protein LAZ67_11002258 [Cordylochernes scorpioides]